MVLILDASGSMWGQIDGKAKITIAKEVMTELLDELPADLNAGLTVYGHRRKGDCDDIEMVTPVRRLDAAAIQSEIQAITPRGKTPIAASLLRSAEALKAQPGERVVLLITDGVESCDQDPCAVARGLAEAGVISRIHVVGFGLDDESLATLQCVSAPSEGLLVGAGNADELKAALGEVIVAALPHNLLIRGLDANGEILYLNVQILQDNQPVAKRSGHNQRFSLPPGRYQAEVRYTPLKQTVVLDDVIIEQGRLIEKELVFAESRLRIRGIDGNNKSVYTTSEVYRAGSTESVHKSSGNAPVFTLLPGLYDVKVLFGLTREEQWLRDVRLEAGDNLEQRVHFAFGKLRITALGPDGKRVYIGVTAFDSGAGEQIHRSSGNRPTFTLRPGVYDFEVSAGKLQPQWLRNIEIGDGDFLERQIQF
ncbi:MAG: VWA domain-containing protein [Xanthomonadales bacterium]|nr:VWA domain-containing protein [Xanthomonadales bacterium]